MKTVEAFVDVLGEEKFFELCDSLAGKYLYVPVVKKAAALAETMGYEEFYKLCKAIGGEYVYIPTKQRAKALAKSLHRDTAAEVKKLLSEGQSVAKIAEELSVSRPTIYKIIRRGNKNEH